MNTLKRLALAGLALGALAVAPTAASAADGLSILSPVPELSASEYPSTLTGERFNPGEPFMEGEVVPVKSGSFEVSCDAIALEGEELAGTVAEFDLDASYSECVAGETKIETTVEMNSCQYAYSDMESVSATQYTAETFIACDEGDTIEIVFGGCDLVIPPQALGATSDLLNTDVIPNENEIVVAQTAEDSEVEFTTKGGNCGLVGLGFGEKTHEGSMLLQVLLRGDEDISILPPHPAAEVAAAEYPSVLTGERLDLGAPNVGEITPVKSGSFEVSCEAVELDGGELSENVTEFDLAASYSECVAGETKIETTVEMNSCHYSYSDLDFVATDRYDATAAISCDEGEVIEMTFGGCKLIIPAQGLGSPAELVNWDGIPEDDEVVYAETAEDSEVEFTTKGGNCGLVGLGFGEKTHEGSMLLQVLLRGEGSA